MKARLPLIAALAVALFPLKAAAQAWVSNPDFSEGIGIRAGDFELHPSVGAEFGYDSNYFRAAESEHPVDALKLRVTPSLSLRTLGNERRQTPVDPKVVFGTSAYASYFELFPLDSANSEARNRRNVAIGVDARLDVFPKGKVGFDALAGYTRAIEAEGNTDDLAGEGFNRDTLRGGAGLTWRPGGGLFDWRGGYLGTFHTFEDHKFRSLENLQHEIGTRGRWRFLPRSSLLFDATYTMVRYTGSTVQTDGDIVQSRAGFHGLVTYHLALLGMLGWASTFYQQHAGSIVARQFDSLIGNAEARWFIQGRTTLEGGGSAPAGLSSVALGYTRTVNNSYYGSFYQRDRGYVQFTSLIVGAVAAGLEFGVSRVAYPESSAANPGIDQLRLDGRLFGEYRFAEQWGINATVQYDQVNSPAVNSEELKYTRWQAYLGVRWFM